MDSLESFYPDLKTSLGRYKILYDRHFELAPDIKENHYVKVKFSNLPIKKIHYDAGATTFNNRGIVLGMMLTNNATASQIAMAGESRLRYYG